jgi:phosphoribosylamine--glycine ligase
VLLVEKLKGIEFTIMGITDGQNLVASPASYDYPFRFENENFLK